MPPKPFKIKAAFGPEFKEYEIGDIVKLATQKPLRLTSGIEISNFNIAYQTFGKLNADKSNAILICHALTGDQYLAGKHPITKKDGWWDFMVGPGKSIDTDKFFVICPNILGGCSGSFGPRDINEETGQSYDLNFPFITMSDMVNAQKLLIESFEIEKLYAVIGGSMGGMHALEWGAKYPSLVNKIICIAASYRHSPQNIGFNEVARQAIMADPGWCEGKYVQEKQFPAKGLAVARMAAHITYLSDDALQEKFGRNLQDKKAFSYDFGIDFKVESYLRHQGFKFVDRFDPNSYIYISKAMDYFDLAADNGGKLSNALQNSAKVKFCIVSFSSDWLFPSSESKAIVMALSAIGANVSYVEMQTSKGHDAFLIENQPLKDTVSGFLNQN